MARVEHLVRRSEKFQAVQSQGPLDITPENQEQLDQVINVINGDIEFGDPQDPNDPTSTTRAGGTGSGSHNGTLSNIMGSWVDVSLTSANVTKVACNHNLYLNSPEHTVSVSGEPNCRWLIFGIMHDNQGEDSTSSLDVSVSFLGDTVSVNSIELRFDPTTAGTAVTIDADHPILVTLFFTRASRGE